MHDRLGDVHRIERRLDDAPPVGLERAKGVTRRHARMCVSFAQHEPRCAEDGDMDRHTNVNLGHGNVEMASFDGAGLGQPRHGVLGACVCRRMRPWDVRSERTIVDDPACSRKRNSSQRYLDHRGMPDPRFKHPLTSHGRLRLEDLERFTGAEE